MMSHPYPYAPSQSAVREPTFNNTFQSTSQTPSAAKGPKPTSTVNPTMENAQNAQNFQGGHPSQSTTNASQPSTMEEVQALLGDHPTIWVFGYGSLLWKPGFQYKTKRVGYIDGYERKFHQGNETFRGVPGQPGRVANLEEKKGSQTWGVAYEISGREEVTSVLHNLYIRESACGGYVTMITTFYPRQERSKHSLDATLTSDDGSDSDSDSSISSDDSQSDFLEAGFRRTDSISSDMSCDDVDAESDAAFDFDFDSKSSSNVTKTPSAVDFYIGDHQDRSMAPVQALVYTATPDNDLYLGSDDVTAMARQITNSAGSAGTNVEYVTKIADYVRKYIPEDEDTHLFHLDAKIREEVYRQHATGSRRLQVGLSDITHDLVDKDFDALVEPVRAA